MCSTTSGAMAWVRRRLTFETVVMLCSSIQMDAASGGVTTARWPVAARRTFRLRESAVSTEQIEVDKQHEAVDLKRRVDSEHHGSPLEDEPAVLQEFRRADERH